jgi:hypothetical protein
MVEEPLGHDFNQLNSQKPHQLPTRPLHGVPVEVLHDPHHNSHQVGGYVVRSCVKGKGVGRGPTLAWPGWKQPDIPVEVDTDRLETSRSEAGVLKKLGLAGIAKLSRLKYR